jgi:hypothetical protein
LRIKVALSAGNAADLLLASVETEEDLVFIRVASQYRPYHLGPFPLEALPRDRAAFFERAQSRVTRGLAQGRRHAAEVIESGGGNAPLTSPDDWPCRPTCCRS